MTNFERIANDRDLILDLVVENDDMCMVASAWYCNRCPHLDTCRKGELDCHYDMVSIVSTWLDAECQEEKEEEP